MYHSGPSIIVSFYFSQKIVQFRKLVSVYIFLLLIALNIINVQMTYDYMQNKMKGMYTENNIFSFELC